ncbi:MAG TPA: SDR family oxidoreductase [Balneolales bacterium]|nr:SDR family oxidoreductase [Balneolales bacterium]
MKNKVALVTGAASGIGRATALAFAKEGAKVVVADWKQKECDETAHLVEKNNGKAISLQVDVSSSKQIQKMVQDIIKEFGQLDYACNNAGIEGEQAFMDKMSEENWERVISINLQGAWICMKHEIAVMKKNGGAIVNIASVAGLIGFPGYSPYVASKHGLNGITKTAALEYAANRIRVNAICPGAIQTPMIDRILKEDPETIEQMIAKHPLGRFGKPEEVADAVIWLCSDNASFITGVVLPVDGGYTAQ